MPPREPCLEIRSCASRTSRRATVWTANLSRHSMASTSISTKACFWRSPVRRAVGNRLSLNLIGCIDTPTSGRLLIDGENVADRTPDELARLRARAIGFIFQTFNLFPVLSAAENVEYPLLKRRSIGIDERRKRVRAYLDLVGLSEFAEPPSESAIGRAAAAGCDRARPGHPPEDRAGRRTDRQSRSPTGKRILRLMRKINRTTRTTFVFSTHDPKVLDMADRRVDLEDGEIVRLGVRVGKEWTFAHERGQGLPF